MVGETNATIHGTVNPQGSQSSAWFEYGTTESLGNIVGTQSVGSGLFDIAHSFSLSGLQSNRTYYFRAIAENQYGKTYGGIVMPWDLPCALWPENLVGIRMNGKSWGFFMMQTGKRRKTLLKSIP